MTLQQYWFFEALKEAGIAFNKVEYFHDRGISILYPSAGVDPLPIFYKYPIWPRWVMQWALERTRGINRKPRACFIGNVTPRRKWLKEHPVVDTWHSMAGRDDSNKFRLDKHYLLTMSEYEYAACPTGDHAWSYRLFESVMAGCIPLVEDHDIFRGVFPNVFSLTSLKESSNYANGIYFSEALSNKNMEILIQKCTLHGKL